MALGYNVDKGTLDMKAASTVLQLRQAFDNVKALSTWVGNHPNPGPGPENDPLVVEYGYSPDEVYVLRTFFETMEDVRTANANTFELGRKMTGLE